MKQFKVTNLSDKPVRVPGAAGILMPAGASCIFSAKDCSLSLLKENKAFSIEEIIFESAPLKAIQSKQSKPLQKEVTRSKGKTSSAKPSDVKKGKVSDNG